MEELQAACEGKMDQGLSPSFNNEFVFVMFWGFRLLCFVS